MSDQDRIDELLENSSLGALGARSLSARTPDSVAAAIVRHADLGELRDRASDGDIGAALDLVVAASQRGDVREVLRLVDLGALDVKIPEHRARKKAALAAVRSLPRRAAQQEDQEALQLLVQFGARFPQFARNVERDARAELARLRASTSQAVAASQNRRRLNALLAEEATRLRRAKSPKRKIALGFPITQTGARGPDVKRPPRRDAHPPAGAFTKYDLIRSWARGRGFDVPDGGAIPPRVVDAFNQFDSAERSLIRSWARLRGMQVADEGQLPQEVLDAYSAEH